MAYDEELANRIRELVQDEAGMSEKAMFGGLAFLRDGHMAVAAGTGGLMVRTDPEQVAHLVEETGVRQMEMRGRRMGGWLLVDDAVLDAEAVLRRWVEHGIARARSLPPK